MKKSRAPGAGELAQGGPWTADTSAWARAGTEEVAPRWREVVKSGERGFGVLHYDRHFDTLATVLTFTSQWVAPAGSID